MTPFSREFVTVNTKRVAERYLLENRDYDNSLSLRTLDEERYPELTKARRIPYNSFPRKWIKYRLVEMLVQHRSHEWHDKHGMVPATCFISVSTSLSAACCELLSFASFITP
jgi:hypothetical protein